MRIMFYGLDGTGTDRLTGGGYVPDILISAATLWNGKRFKRFYPPLHRSLFLDSGGFSFFYRKGDYPFAPEELADLSKLLRADITAVMDYPCEPDTTRPDGLRTNSERIHATVRNTERCLDIKGVRWLPVLQGYRLSDYALCAELLNERGLVDGHLAIGSLCVRKRLDEAWRVIRFARDRFPGVKLHGFGIDLRFLKDRRIRTALWSADTQAWKWNNRSHGYGVRGILPKSREQILANFESYSPKVDALLESDARGPF